MGSGGEQAGVLAGPTGKDHMKDVDSEPLRDEQLPLREVFLTEAKIQLNLGVPICISSICRQIQAMIVCVVLGRKDSMLLAQVALQGQSTMMLDATVVGGALQIEALCAMALGAGNLPLVGIWMQMALLFVTILFVPFGLMKLATGPVLMFLGVPEELAKGAGLLSMLITPVLVLEMWYMVIRVYFAAQGIVRPDTVINLGLSMVLITFLWAGIWWLDWGIVGYALAMSAKRASHLIVFVWYHWSKGYHKKTWNGFQLKEVMIAKRWQVFLSMAIPGMIGGVLEVAHWGIMVVMAARLGAKSSVAYDMTMNFWALMMAITTGLANGTSITMGTYLGQGRPKKAETAMQVGIVGITAVSVLYSTIYYHGIPHFMRMASTDPAVISLVVDSYMVPFMAIGIAFAAICTFLGDMLLKQGRIAEVMLPSPLINWFCGLPVSFFLAPRLGVTGIAVGLAASDVVRCFVFAWLLWKSDWQQIAQDARARAEQTPASIKTN